jgi:hypothetical protein
MSKSGNVHIGFKAPDFKCEAVIGRKITGQAYGYRVHQHCCLAAC